jgi:hypothetical protein
MPILTTLGAAAARAYGLLARVILQGIGYIDLSTGISTNNNGAFFTAGNTSTALFGIGQGRYTPGGPTARNSAIITKYNNTATIQAQTVTYLATAVGGSSDLVVYRSYVDSSGYVYFTGLTQGGSAIGQRAFVVKCNSTNLFRLWTWSAPYANATSDYYVANSVVVDSSGNVYQSGSINYDNGGYPYNFINVIVKKFNSSGVEQLSYQFGANLSGSAIARNNSGAISITIDSSNNVYPYGGTGDVDGYYPMGFINKLNLTSTGSQTWARVIYDVGGYYDWGNAVYGAAIDTSGNVYTASTAASIVDNYLSTVHFVKMNSSGTFVTSAMFWDDNYVLGAQVGYANAFKVDSSGNLYCVVRAGSLDCFVLLKLDSNLNLIWQRKVSAVLTSTSAGQTIVGSGLTISGNGDIVVTSYISTGGTNDQAQLLFVLPANGAKLGNFVVGSYTFTISATTGYVLSTSSMTSGNSSSTLNTSSWGGDLTTLGVMGSASLTPTSTVVTI